VAIFALMDDAHRVGNDKACRACAYQLKRLGWRVELVEAQQHDSVLAAVAFFTLMVNAHQGGKDKVGRLYADQLRRLGWRVEPMEPLGEAVEQ
jgi:hypothetical protein